MGQKFVGLLGRLVIGDAAWWILELVQRSLLAFGNLWVVLRESVGSFVDLGRQKVSGNESQYFLLFSFDKRKLYVRVCRNFFFPCYLRTCGLGSVGRGELVFYRWGNCSGPIPHGLECRSRASMFDTIKLFSPSLPPSIFCFSFPSLFVSPPDFFPFPTFYSLFFLFLSIPFISIPLLSFFRFSFDLYSSPSPSCLLFLLFSLSLSFSLSFLPIFSFLSRLLLFSRSPALSSYTSVYVRPDVTCIDCPTQQSIRPCRSLSFPDVLPPT